jgi:hypothetical protein
VKRNKVPAKKLTKEIQRKRNGKFFLEMKNEILFLQTSFSS